MNYTGCTLVIALASISVASATELQVAISGNDANSGTVAAPFKTIQHAADLAQPGDVITVHAGVYRERIDPPRGGVSDQQRITYQAATGERVEIAGSEIIKSWTKMDQHLWKTVIPNRFFGSFNPYQDAISGDWYEARRGRINHTGCVYLNGQWLMEAQSFETIRGAAPEPTTGAGHWFATVDANTTTIWISLKEQDADPNRETTEINVRRTVFYPSKTGINYITLRGFVLRDAATPWAPPTAEQIGLVGTNWSKGWIIENNRVFHSVCAGIALGKYGDEYDNTACLPTTKGGSSLSYIETIKRAIVNGWSKENIGHHIVRHNEVFECGQVGVVGSLGAVFSTVTGNTIHDIYGPTVKQMFGGAEMGGVKLHAAVDVTIDHNHIYRCGHEGIWLDWMAQGARVSCNLMDGNDSDLFTEVDHGPILLDNNLFLSPGEIHICSQGLAFVHNVICGQISDRSDGRKTPLFKPHTLEVVNYLENNLFGDKRYCNNLFVGRTDLTLYDNHPKEKQMLPVVMEGNVFAAGAKPSALEKDPILMAALGEAPKLILPGGKYYLSLNLEKEELQASATRLVTTETLGKSAVSQEAFENPDGSPLKVATDYLGNSRNPSKPTPGCFESWKPGIEIQVW